MYHRLSAGSMIKAKMAWTLSEISRKCTNAAIAMCMSWPQAYAPSTICFVPCFLGAELATVPSKVLQEWAAAGFPMPDQDFVYKGVDGKGKDLKPIPYKDLDPNGLQPVVAIVVCDDELSSLLYAAFGPSAGVSLSSSACASRPRREPGSPLLRGVTGQFAEAI